MASNLLEQWIVAKHEVSGRLSSLFIIHHCSHIQDALNFAYWRVYKHLSWPCELLLGNHCVTPSIRTVFSSASLCLTLKP